MLSTPFPQDLQEPIEARAIARMTPIELMFWRAAKEHSGDTVHLVTSPEFPFNPWGWGPAGIPSDHIIIAFQVYAAGPIVDFAITRRILPRHGTLFVECDGHEWHERTKEQARRDRFRDRHLQRLGQIHRYTGSELYHGAYKCWEHAVRALDERHHLENKMACGALP